MRVGLALLFLLFLPVPSAFAKYFTPARVAHITLLVQGGSRTVELLSEDNATVRFVPAQFFDLNISPAIDLECQLAFTSRLSRIRVRADNRYNLIPANVVEYKDYDPTYLKLEIDTSYFTDDIARYSLGAHKIYIDIFAAP